MIVQRYALLSCALVVGCSTDSPDPRTPRPRLAEKGRYQALYALDGRLERLLYDSNGDRRADVMSLYGPEGKVLESEIDTDLDGVVDRWESYDAQGRLVRVATSRGATGKPDLWEIPRPDGRAARREHDDDRDGTPDRDERVGVAQPPRANRK